MRNYCVAPFGVLMVSDEVLLKEEALSMGLANTCNKLFKSQNVLVYFLTKQV